MKTLHGDHLSRAIGKSLLSSCLPPHVQAYPGRIAGQDGKTKFTIENASRTRIVLADTYEFPSALYGESINMVSFQENTHHGLIPEYQNCSGCDRISHSGLSAWQGIRRVEDSK